MKVICEHAGECSNAEACNHGVPHEQWEGCIVGKCYHHSVNGDNTCIEPLVGWTGD